MSNKIELSYNGIDFSEKNIDKIIDSSLPTEQSIILKDTAKNLKSRLNRDIEVLNRHNDNNIVGLPLVLINHNYASKRYLKDVIASTPLGQVFTEYDLFANIFHLSYGDFEKINKKLKIKPQLNTNKDAVFKEFMKICIYLLSMHTLMENVYKDDNNSTVLLRKSTKSLKEKINHIYNILHEANTSWNEEEIKSLATDIAKWRSTFSYDDEVSNWFQCVYDCYFISDRKDIGKELFELKKKEAEKLVEYEFEYNIKDYTWGFTIESLFQECFNIIMIYAKLWYYEYNCIKLLHNYFKEIKEIREENE